MKFMLLSQVFLLLMLSMLLFIAFYDAFSLKLIEIKNLTLNNHEYMSFSLSFLSSLLFEYLYRKFDIRQVLLNIITLCVRCAGLEFDEQARSRHQVI
jgi:hypothetical protein